MAIIKVDYGTIGGGIPTTPIWINPNPSSTFNAQTISIDLTGYDRVFIVNAYATSEIDTDTCGFVDVGSSGTVGTKDSRFYRTYTVSQSDVTISNQASTAHGNSYCIPYYIIGIKN